MVLITDISCFSCPTYTTQQIMMRDRRRYLRNCPSHHKHSMKSLWNQNNKVRPLTEGETHPSTLDHKTDIPTQICWRILPGPVTPRLGLNDQSEASKCSTAERRSTSQRLCPGGRTQVVQVTGPEPPKIIPDNCTTWDTAQFRVPRSQLRRF